MSEQITKVEFILGQAKNYERLTWLGLLLFPLGIIFAVMTSNKVNEAKMHKMTAEEQKQGEAIVKSARNIAILLVGLWIIGVAIYVATMANAANSLPYYGSRR